MGCYKTEKEIEIINSWFRSRLEKVLQHYIPVKENIMLYVDLQRYRTKFSKISLMKNYKLMDALNVEAIHRNKQSKKF